MAIGVHRSPVKGSVGDGMGERTEKDAGALYGLL